MKETLEDQLIIKKLNERSEEAIKELSDKYGALCRGIANTAKKRNTHYDVALDELEECLAGDSSVEGEILAKELEQGINDFLSELKKADRIMFVRRYWFFEPVSEIAGNMGRSNNYVTVHLHRSRKKLENYLKMKGLIQ